MLSIPRAKRRQGFTLRSDWSLTQRKLAKREPVLVRGRSRTMFNFLGYVCLILLEAISLGTSVYDQPGGATVGAVAIGILAAAPTANRCAERMFAFLTCHPDQQQPA
jgi:hypothetical protein